MNSSRCPEQPSPLPLTPPTSPQQSSLSPQTLQTFSSQWVNAQKSRAPSGPCLNPFCLVSTKTSSLFWIFPWRKYKLDHITFLLKTLHWLPVSLGIKFQLLHRAHRHYKVWLSLSSLASALRVSPPASYPASCCSCPSRTEPICSLKIPCPFWILGLLTVLLPGEASLMTANL